MFNVFVCLQVFNFLNCRKVGDQFNILSNILGNYLFLIILLVIMASQILIISFLGNFFKLYPYGLTAVQWAICIGVGSLSLLVSGLLKLIKVTD